MGDVCYCRGRKKIYTVDDRRSLGTPGRTGSRRALPSSRDGGGFRRRDAAAESFYQATFILEHWNSAPATGFFVYEAVDVELLHDKAEAMVRKAWPNARAGSLLDPPAHPTDCHRRASGDRSL